MSRPARSCHCPPCPHCDCPSRHAATWPSGEIEWGYTDKQGRRWTHVPYEGMRLLDRPHFKPAPKKETRWARALRRLAAGR